MDNYTTLLHGDCLTEMAAMDAGSVDAVVTDPPYALTNRVADVPACDSCGRQCGGGDHVRVGDPCPRCGVPLIFRRTMTGAGFMGKDWDNGLVAFSPEVWAEALRVLKPSHYLLAFGGTRTWHRLACAIEDAGFEIRDTLMWEFGSGFPKGRASLKPAYEPVIVAQKPATVPQYIQTMLDIIDERIAEWQAHGPSEAGTSPLTSAGADTVLSTLLSWKLTLAGICEPTRTSTTSTATGATTDWKTLSFCLSQITPADIIAEPTLPSGLSASASDAARYFNAELLRMYLTRDLSVLAPAIESARISHQDETGLGLRPNWTPIILARKPGPMRELGIEECRIATERGRERQYDSEPQSGVTGSDAGHIPFTSDHLRNDGWMAAGRWPANLILDEEAGAMLDGQTGTLTSGGGDRAGKHRTGLRGNPAPLKTPCLIPASSGGASRFFYCSKASRSERNAGLHQVGHHDVAGAYGEFAGDGRGRQTEHRPARNHHPTVKPLALMRWLVKLVAQPGDVVLDPFAGSGTTGVACAEEGREFIGIDQDADYIEIARRRIDHASAQGMLPLDESPPLPPVAGRPT